MAATAIAFSSAALSNYDTSQTMAKIFLSPALANFSIALKLSSVNG
jgi:hypothetical protein